jgi:hypothetical protein
MDESSNDRSATRRELDEAVHKILERLEATETKLLGAFFSYQEYDRIENRKFRADLSNVSAASDLRFDNLEVRIAALERALLSKPDSLRPHKDKILKERRLCPRTKKLLRAGRSCLLPQR